MRRRDFLSALLLLATSACVGGGRAARQSSEPLAPVDISPEEEHYLGRAVAAHILERYPPTVIPEVQEYLSTLGQTLAAASDRPQTYGGYAFQLLASDEWNAFATPGGYIFLTRGLALGCASEDQLAAVLAHEIAHVQSSHGLAALRRTLATGLAPMYAAATAGTGRGTNQGTSQGTARGQSANQGRDGGDAPRPETLAEKIARLGSWRLLPLADRTRLFSQMVNDIFEMVVVNGYALDQEFQADAQAEDLMARVGYQPLALADLLAVCDQRLTQGHPRIVTHPSPRQRLEALRRHLPAFLGLNLPTARRQRFHHIQQVLRASIQ